MSLRLVACLSGLALLGGCGSAPPRPAPSSAQRFNGEGLRRLERGDARGADEMFHDALREAELIDDLQGQAEAWNNLGALASARGQPREAWACHASALRLYQARGLRDAGEIRARTNLGGAMLLLGAVAEAAEQFQQATALADALSTPAAGAMARVGLASVELRRGNAAAAADLARREARSARGDEAALAAALSIEGAALDAQNKLPEARSRHEEALALDRRRERPSAVADDLRALARIAERQGDRPAAASFLARSARIARRMGDLEKSVSELTHAVELLGPHDPESQALQAEIDAIRAALKAQGPSR